MNFFESLAALATRRPVAVCVVAIGIALIGYLSWERRPIDLLPDLQSPTVVVSVQSGQKPPFEMDGLYGQWLEQRIFSVKGVRDIEQVARTGRLVATVNFDWEANIDIGLIDVQKSLSNLASNPGVDEVVVRRFDPRQDPILVYGMVATADQPGLIEMRQLARRQLAVALEQLDGVAEVKITGGRLKEVRIDVDRYRLNAFGVSLQMLQSRLQEENLDVSAGTIETNENVYQLRGKTRLTDAQEVRDLIVRFIETPGGIFQPVKVADFANVIETEQEIDHLVLVNGIEGIGLSIYKEPGANTVEVVRELKEAIEALERDLYNIELIEIADNAKLVVDALDDLQVAAGIGVLLAVIVLAVFLRAAGPTLIVAAAVPVSICSTLFFMHLGDYSLNIVTLGGLALGAGMLVDNAIVVVESMYRHANEGLDPKTAASRGTGQVAGAITASTLTTCVVFLPVFFVQGLAARLIDGIAFTVVLSLLASLFVAVFLIPALGRWFLPTFASAQEAKVKVKVSRFRRGSEVLSAKLLKVPYLVVLVGIAAAGGAIYFLMQLGTELLPPNDPKQFSVRVVAPSGQRVESTTQLVDGVEQMLRDASANTVAATLSEIGQLPDDDRIIRRELTEENTARINVRVSPEGPTGRDIANVLQNEVELIEDVEFTWEVNKSALSEAIGTGGMPILVEVSGTTLEEIRRGAELLHEEMAKLPQIWDLQSSFHGGPPELRVKLDHVYAGALGITSAAVSRVLSANLDGLRSSSITLGDEEYPITIRMDTPRIDELGEITFMSQSGREIAVGEVATFEYVEGPREIFRRNQRSVAQLTALVADGYELPQAVEAVQQVIKRITLPSGVLAALRGEEEERKKTFGELQLAGILAIALVLMVLSGSFESLLQPITILSAIPLALVGVAAVLYPVGDPVGVMAMLGLIVLAGVAVNDAVLLISTAQQLIKQGIERREALAQAVGIRLRPVTMTTLTTVFALTPLLFGGGEGAILRQPMAMTIIGGIITSTVGSLLVLPSLFLIVDNLQKFLLSFRRPKLAVTT